MSDAQPSSDQSCKCVSCAECRGTGTVWVSFSGKYLGSGRCDDLDDMETCMECQGSGIVEECHTCEYRREMDEEELYGY